MIWNKKPGINHHWIVSCLFGNSSKFGIYPAPEVRNTTCLFFSNNPTIGGLAKQRGWTFVPAPMPLLDGNYVETSLQSKWVKYLQFMKNDGLITLDFPNPSTILYFDHKFFVKPENVKRIIATSGGHSLLLRTTPVEKTTVSAEIAEAAAIERYARHMSATRAYVARQIALGRSDKFRICNTGLIHYRDLGFSMALAQKVYDCCITLKQPECQIFWAVNAQPVSDKILTIPWTDPRVADIEWVDPRDSAQYNSGVAGK